MQLKPGTRLQSQTCETQVMVVRAAASDVDLRCGGLPMAAMGDIERGAPADGFDGGTLMGKRYVYDEPALELLCTKPGAGSLSVGKDILATKDAKALPSSD
jgi:hypothetical protein